MTSRPPERRDSLPVGAVLTLGETLFPHQRELIERTFQCPVYDAYGGEAMEATCENLHAADVSAYPLPEDAVSALAVGHHRKRMLDRPRPLPEPFHIDRELITRYTGNAIQGRAS